MAEKDYRLVNKDEESNSSEKYYNSGYDDRVNSDDLNKKRILKEENREDGTIDYTSDKKDGVEGKVIYTGLKKGKNTEEEKTEQFKNYEKDKVSGKNNKEHFNNGKINDFLSNVKNESSNYTRNADKNDKYNSDDGNEMDTTKEQKDGSSSNKGGNNFATGMSSNNSSVAKNDSSFEYNLNVDASTSGEKYYSLSNDKENNSSNKIEDVTSSEKNRYSDDVAKDEKDRIAASSKGKILNVKNNEIDNHYSSNKKNEALNHDADGSKDDLMRHECSSDDNESMKAKSEVSDINLFLEDLIDKVEQSRDDSTAEQKPFSSTMRLDPRKSFADSSRRAFDFQVKPCNSCEFFDTVEEENGVCCGLYKRRQKRYLEFWFISVPKEEDTWTTLNAETKSKTLSQNYKFHIPKLKVGVLNDLMSLIEQLLTLDNYVKDVVEKICDNTPRIRSSIDGKDEKFQVHNLNAETYLTRFTWNNSKYSSKLPVRNISDIIFSKVESQEKILMKKVSLYEEVKVKLRKYERREQDPLQNRFLGDIVKKEHFVLNSKYLITLLVVVPNDKVKLWCKTYESMCDKVIPQSSNKIFDDGTHCLFNVTIYRNEVEEFKSNARKMKFIVREFQFSEKMMAIEREHIKHLSRTKSKHCCSLSRFTNISFVECFEAWIHVKALRIFVESVVRYGFPVNFQAMLIQPRKSKTKLKKVLQRLYSKVDVSLASGCLPDIPGNLANFNVHEYYPYVFLRIDLNFLYKNINC